MDGDDHGLTQIVMQPAICKLSRLMTSLAAVARSAVVMAASWRRS
jgi:hypothetical protein